MQIYYGLTISEFVGLIVGGITLVVLLVYYGARAIIRAWKSRRTPYALDGATGAAKEQARRNEFLRKYFPSIYPPRK